MLCEKCKKRTATLFYNENINGKARSYSLCGECAAKLREIGDLQDITSLAGSFADPFSAIHDELFGGFFGIPSLSKSSSNQKRCPSCSCSYSEIAESGKVGCPVCYEIFQNELSGMIESFHGTTTHTGNIPARHRAKQARAEELKKLKQELQTAIQEENYEKGKDRRYRCKKLW